jgi:hypothetical protein
VAATVRSPGALDVVVNNVDYGLVEEVSEAESEYQPNVTLL